MKHIIHFYHLLLNNITHQSFIDLPTRIRDQSEKKSKVYPMRYSRGYFVYRLDAHHNINIWSSTVLATAII
jgi:hypothetical protein